MKKEDNIERMVFVGIFDTLLSITSEHMAKVWTKNFIKGEHYKVNFNFAASGFAYCTDDTGYIWYLPTDCFESDDTYGKLKL